MMLATQMHKVNIIDTYMTYRKRPHCIVGRFEQMCVAYSFQVLAEFDCKLRKFFLFLNLSVTCWLAVNRLSVTCQPTDFLGSSSPQLPKRGYQMNISTKSYPH